MTITPQGEFERTPGGAVLMDGIRLRGEIIASLRSTIEAAGSPPVCLATVLVGDDKPSRLYVGSKRKLAGEAGMTSKHVELGNDATQSQVPDVGFRGHEGHGDLVSDLATAQVGFHDHGVLVGRAEAGRALHRTNASSR